MTSSFRDDPYRRPNFATNGTIPGYLRPRVPPIPPVFPDQPPPWPEPPSVPAPFPAPLPSQQPPAHEVDPSDRNPYNDPDWSPFLITERQVAPQGGLLGRLLAVLAEQARDAPDVHENGYGSPA